MADIVERLRDCWLGEPVQSLVEEAADEIERLRAVEADYDDHEREMIDLEEDNARFRAENDKLRAALELFECDCEGEELCFNTDNCRNFIARATLSGDKHE